MTTAPDRNAVIARALLVSASTLLLIGLLINVDVFPVDPSAKDLIVGALTAVGVVDIAIALWFRSRSRARQR
jgi:hypothetical protein